MELLRREWLNKWMQHQLILKEHDTASSKIRQSLIRCYCLGLGLIKSQEQEIFLRKFTEDKTLVEQVKLIQELEPEEKSMVFKMVDTFLTQKKFKDFFQKKM